MSPTAGSEPTGSSPCCWACGACGSAGGAPVSPGSPVANPAFDVTPAELVTALVTETGVLEVARGQVPGGVPPGT